MKRKEKKKRRKEEKKKRRKEERKKSRFYFGPRRSKIPRYHSQKLSSSYGILLSLLLPLTKGG